MRFRKQDKKRIIAAYVAGKSTLKLSKKFGAHPASVNRFLRRNRIKIRRPGRMPDWTEEDDRWLRKNFSDKSNKDCAQCLGRSKEAIALRAHKLRIFKSKEWKSKPHPPDCLHCARRRKHLRYIEGGVSPVCECHSLPMRHRHKAWYCRKKIYEWERRGRLKKFGINEQIFERMMREQNGMCFICQKPPSRRWNRLAIDHNHQTGKVRKLLCVTCNAALGWYEKHQKQIEEYLA